MASAAARELFERLGDRYGIGSSLIRLGHLAILEGGRLDDARSMLQQGLALANEVGDRWGHGAANLFLGVLSAGGGQQQVAGDHLRRSLEIFLPLGDVVMLSAALIEYAHVVAPCDPRRGARLVGAAVAIRRRLGGRLPPFAMGVIERTRWWRETRSARSPRSGKKRGAGGSRSRGPSRRLWLPICRAGTMRLPA